MNKTLLALAAAALLATGSAFASPITGTFTIDIYHGTNASGQVSDPMEQASLSNPLLAPAYKIASITYTGPIDFNASADNITNFLQSAIGGSYSFVFGNAGVLSATDLSAIGFTDTTLFDIHGTSAAVGLIGSISHDDGITLYQNNVAIAASAPPTQKIDTNYTLGQGAFELVYVAANGLPQVLNMDVQQTIPEPTSVLLASVALLGLGLSSRRIRKAA